MNKIFVIMGKSSSGKDSIARELLSCADELNLSSYVPYTTRPIRQSEQEGVDYFFVSDKKFDSLIENNKMLEYRSYNTVNGIWRYGTVYDEQLNTDKNILILLTLEGYNSLVNSNIIGKDKIIPIYVQVDDGIRLSRALSREKKQTNPNYKEMCRRFLADTDDFSEEKLTEAGITKRFHNYSFKRCVNSVKKYIQSFN